jgi:glutamate/tyrosine decarboxylase-like PLP-dependent enzyme
MKHKDSIERLRNRQAPIDMTPEEFKKAGHKLVDDIAEFLGAMRERPVNLDEKPSDLKALLPERLPENGMDAATLLNETAPMLFDHSLLNGHPRFYGYITAGPTPIGMLGDMLAASINPNLGGWQLSPIASEIEKQSVRWIAEMIGFPTDGFGLFVSGGNMANFVCFLAARRAKADWDIRAQGLGVHEGRMLVYASSETHTWIQKALDLFGHGADAIRTIPVDEELRADVTSLASQIEEDRRRGDKPFLIVGSAGTVSTGAIDPLPAMAAIAREHDLWFHVDGAYGALAAVLPDAPSDLKALSEADSVAVDPHKWLYAPLEAGVALVRHPEALPDAFSYRPPYYHFEEEDEPKTNFYEYGFQNSRGFRALKVWLALRQVGRSGYIRMITDDIALSKEIYRIAETTPELEACTNGLAITTFRFVPEGLAPGDPTVEEYLNELNDALLSRLRLGGELFFSNAIIAGKFLMRACIVNFRTALEDIEAIPEIVLRHGHELDRDMRPSGL